MKIYYDYQMLIEQKYGGISRYFYELINHLNNREDVTTEIKCLFNINEYFAEMFGNPACKIPHISRVSKPLNKICSLHMIGKNCDIIHPTYFDPYILKRKDAPIVITVHDMIHELFPDIMCYDKNIVSYKKQMIYGADHIIAVSQNTKKDILKVYPDIDEDKITVIYHGNSFRNKASQKIELPEEYVLYVGTRDLYKNFDNFMIAMKQLMSRNKKLYLVCAGGGKLSNKEKGIIGDYIDRVVQMDIKDSYMPLLYQQAICLVFPSKYEGFGIPIIEAFSCDCPVVLSNAGPMPEIAGDAGLYFDPNDVEEMENRILAVIQNDDIRKSLSEEGRRQLENYNWDKTAEETYICYKKVRNNWNRN